MSDRELFVIMPFGVRDAEHVPTGRLDFDGVYQAAIREAATAAGWSVSRIDELVAPGTVGTQYLERILAADLVLADISVPNGNVYYELGVRHAVTAAGTLLIAAQETIIPFDLSSHRVLFYENDAAGWAELQRRLCDALKTFDPEVSDNPVRSYLERVGLQTSPTADSSTFERDFAGRIDRARNREQLIAVWYWARPRGPLPVAPLQALASRLADFGEWELAAEVLRTAAGSRPDDFEIHRQRGWYLRQLGEAHDGEAVEAFNRALELNSDDPETLGMLAGRLKRRGELEEALGLYDRAAQVAPNSLYIAVNRAAVKVLIGGLLEEALEDYGVLVERLRGEQTLRPFDEWDELVLGEALFALGTDDAATEHYGMAMRLSTSPKPLESAADQLGMFERSGFRAQAARRLRRLLESGWVEGTTASVHERDAASLTTERPGPILLHLSDVHFAGQGELGQPDARHRFFDGPDTQPLIEELRRELVAGDIALELPADRLHVVVSGDLAWTGSEEEFAQAQDFLEGLVGMLGIERERMHLVPGNHDLNWHLSKANRDRRLDNYLRLLVGFYGEDVVRHRYPLIAWPLQYAGPPPDAHQLVSICFDEKNAMLLCGLNSCVLEDEQHHYGYVGQRQQKELRRHLSALDLPVDLVRVAVMHHHLHPYPEFLMARTDQEVFVDLSIVRDAGALERELEQLGFDLVLHGHKHRPQLRETRVREVGAQKGDRRPLIVCGAGSVSCTQLEHAQANQYQCINVVRVPRETDAEFIRLTWRELPVEAGADWATVQTWSILG
ncbi:MAG TPA: metallophosphoesterase [Solirubrobacteraceae bacterium]|nr:metallophosphoesterase [Solirubrobacteraceae bacterium]